MLSTPQKILSSVVVWSKYAKYIPEAKRRETWEEICTRNMMMHIRKFPFLEKEIRNVYDKFVVTKKVLPSMRSMQFGGLPIELNNSRIFNCFSGDTKFITDNGIKSFKDTVGSTVNVLAEDGVFRAAEVKSFGKQTLNRVSVKAPYRTNLRMVFEATPNHRWILVDGSETTTLNVGDKVRTSTYGYDETTDDYINGFVHGLVFADGTRTHLDNRFMMRMCGDKGELLDVVKSSKYFRTVCFPPSNNSEPTVSFVTDVPLKNLPETGVFSHDYIAGFIKGWVEFDGGKKANTASWNLDTQDADAADWLVENAPYAGYVATGFNSHNRPTNFGERSSPLNRISLRKEIPAWIVESIEETESSEEVYCVVEPVTKTFTLAGGVLTGNCSYAPVDSLYSFSEAMFLLLGGSGYGYSVQKHHTNKLGVVKGPRAKHRRFVVGDSIEGWADAIKQLMKAFFEGRMDPEFDFRDIRPKGARLITAGGRAPGPDPLRICLDKIRAVLNGAVGRKLTPLECHDILCHIADAVLSGGIRRAAMICFFDHDDIEMLTCKSGAWWELNPQRGRANNSAVLLRDEITYEQFKAVWKRVEESGAGEPGVYWTNDKDILSNPCVEATLRPYSFCNLTEMNVTDVESQEDLNARARAAAFIGTLQASYTDFHYLRDIWKETTEEDALIGVGQTGIASGAVLGMDLSAAAKEVVAENARVAKMIGINTAARTSLVKPSGTSSLTVGSSSGIHAWHDDFYIRRMRVGKNEAIYHYLKEKMPEFVEDCVFKPHLESVVSFPQKAPEGAITRSESAMDLLERVLRFNKEWIHPGHNRGVQRHNVSCTISLKDDEWEAAGEWMWNNRNDYNGIAVLPYFGGNYAQTPFETCDKETYERMLTGMVNIDVTDIIEDDDNTDVAGEAACGGGGCEVV